MLAQEASDSLRVLCLGGREDVVVRKGMLTDAAGDNGRGLGGKQCARLSGSDGATGAGARGRRGGRGGRGGGEGLGGRGEEGMGQHQFSVGFDGDSTERLGRCGDDCLEAIHRVVEMLQAQEGHAGVVEVPKHVESYHAGGSRVHPVYGPFPHEIHGLLEPSGAQADLQEVWMDGREAMRVGDEGPGGRVQRKEPSHQVLDCGQGPGRRWRCIFLSWLVSRFCCNFCLFPEVAVAHAAVVRLLAPPGAARARIRRGRMAQEVGVAVDKLCELFHSSCRLIRVEFDKKYFAYSQEVLPVGGRMVHGHGGGLRGEEVEDA